MSAISGYINTIQNAVYGEQVRTAIINALEACYSDVESPSLQTAAFQTAIENAYQNGILDIITVTSFNDMTNQNIIYRYNGTAAGKQKGLYYYSALSSSWVLIGSEIQKVSLASQMTDTNDIYKYIGTETGMVQNSLYCYNGTNWVPIGSGVLTASTAALMTNTGAIYKYTGTETGYIQNALYYHDGTSWQPIYSANSIDISEYTKFTDLFGNDTNGVVPHKPRTFIQESGEYPSFGFALSLAQDWEKAEYNAPNVTIQSKQGTSVLFNGYPPNWKACFSDLTHIKYTVRSYFMHTLAFGTDGNFLYGLYFNGKIQKANNGSWEDLSGNYPNIASGKEVELWVTPTALTCKVDGVTTSYDISSLNLTYVSFGFIALVSDTNKRSITFENMEVGDGHYEYDNTKFLQSSGDWAVATMRPEGFPEEFKQALLGLFRQMAYVTDEAMTYYNAIRTLLYPTSAAPGWTDNEAYDDITTVSGYQISATYGTFHAAEGWSRTDFIPCQGAAYISFPELGETAMQANHAAFYNQARWRVAGITLSLSGPKDVEVPADAVFFAVSSETQALADLIADGIVPHA